MDQLRQIYLCSSCSESDAYRLIYKSYIKDKYFVDVEELEVRQCESFELPSKWRTYKTLYKVSDVLDVFCIQYDVPRNNSEAIKEKVAELTERRERLKEERSRKRSVKKTITTSARRIELIEALNEYGLELRPDSKLCHGYINGTIKDWTVPQIVQRMCQMKYLYDYCNFDACFEQARENQREERRAGYYPDSNLFDEAEHIALQRYGPYPDSWPWLNN
jgi:hypothetical protein